MNGAVRLILFGACMTGPALCPAQTRTALSSTGTVISGRIGSADRVLSSSQDSVEFCQREARRRSGHPRCVYFVNLSRHAIVEFYYAVRLDAEGREVWSANQFADGGAFAPDRWTSYPRPGGASCYFAIKVVMAIRKERRAFVQTIDLCDDSAPPVFLIRDPQKPVVTPDRAA